MVGARLEAPSARSHARRQNSLSILLLISHAKTYRLHRVASVSVRTGGLAPISEVGGVFAPRGPGVPAERIDGVRRVIGGQLVSSAAVSA
jgi:hypothetical protein